MIQTKEEFNNRGDRELGWLFSDYLNLKYFEYINEVAADLSERVFMERNFDRLKKIEGVLNEL